jgi:hypothetical protein
VEAAEVFYAFELWILLPDEGGEFLARFVCGRRWNGTVLRVQTIGFFDKHNRKKNCL